MHNIWHDTAFPYLLVFAVIMSGVFATQNYHRPVWESTADLLVTLFQCVPLNRDWIFLYRSTVATLHSNISLKVSVYLQPPMQPCTKLFGISWTRAQIYDYMISSEWRRVWWMNDFDGRFEGTRRFGMSCGFEILLCDRPEPVSCGAKVYGLLIHQQTASPDNSKQCKAPDLTLHCGFSTSLCDIVQHFCSCISRVL